MMVFSHHEFNDLSLHYPILSMMQSNYAEIRIILGIFDDGQCSSPQQGV